MCRLRPGSAPSRFAARIAAIGFALTLAGCANSADRTPGSQAAAPSERVALEPGGAAPPPSRNATASASMSGPQQDWLVARAIAAHEMRRP